jgi:hypothetical protein
MYSIDKQVKAKNMDEAILKAMIAVNNRLVVKQNNTDGKGAYNHLMVMKDKREDPTSAKYKANMWLFR